MICDGTCIKKASAVILLMLLLDINILLDVVCRWIQIDFVGGCWWLLLDVVLLFIYLRAWIQIDFVVVVGGGVAV